MKKKQLLRSLLVLVLALACLGGLIYLWIAPASHPSGQVCQEVSVTVKTEQGGEALFLTPERILEELRQRGIRLEGKKLDSIDLRRIEQTLLQLPIYKRAEAFVSPASGKVQIRLTEKLPLFIVFEPSGKSYYVTQGKDTFAVSPTFAAYLPVVSGDVDQAIATGAVYDLLRVIREDPYFADYFGQVYVDRDEGISLIPRIGSTRVILGHGTDWAEKLRKWRIFAESVLPKRGMNAFAYVNLDYAGQIVAGQRYPAEGQELQEPSTPAPVAPAKPSAPKAETPAKAKPEPAKSKSEPAKKATKEEPKKAPKEKTKDKDKDKGKKPAPKAEPKKSTKEKAPAPKPAHKPASKPTSPSQKKK